VRSFRYETGSPQASHVTRPASKSLDEEGTSGPGLSGSSDALRLTGSLAKESEK
jgi:hypothetical protein